MYLGVKLRYGFIHGNIKVILLDPEKYQLISRRLKLGCDDILVFCNIYRKGYKCRRNIYIVEGSGHGILSSDGRKPESDLGIISPQKRRKRLAPAFGIRCHPAEVLLECKSYLGSISSACHDPCH